MIGHHIIGAATVDLGRVHGQPVAHQRFQAQRQIGRGDDGVAPVAWVAPGMGVAPADLYRIVAAAAPRARQRAVRQGRFIGQRGGLALRQPRDQRGGGAGADLLIAVDHDLITDAVFRRARFHRHQGVEHDGDAALHVRHAGAVEDIVLAPVQLLKVALGGKHRVHMAGEQQLHRRIRPHGRDEMPAAIELLDGAVRLHRLDRIGLHQLDLARQRGKGVAQLLRHGGQPLKVFGAAVDPGPGHRAIEHGGLLDLVEDGLFGAVQCCHG